MTRKRYVMLEPAKERDTLVPMVGRLREIQKMLSPGSSGFWAADRAVTALDELAVALTGERLIRPIGDGASLALGPGNQRETP